MIRGTRRVIARAATTPVQTTPYPRAVPRPFILPSPASPPFALHLHRRHDALLCSAADLSAQAGKPMLHDQGAGHVHNGVALPSTACASSGPKYRLSNDAA